MTGYDNFYDKSHTLRKKRNIKYRGQTENYFPLPIETTDTRKEHKERSQNTSTWIEYAFYLGFDNLKVIKF